jgi:hypothetical protein
MLSADSDAAPGAAVVGVPTFAQAQTTRAPAAGIARDRKRIAARRAPAARFILAAVTRTGPHAMVRRTDGRSRDIE